MKLTKNVQELEIAVSKLVAQSWIDDEFRNRLISNPMEVLKEAGLAIGEFVQVIVNQGSTDTPVLLGANGTTLEINLPAKPSNFSDEQIGTWSKKVVDMAGSFRASSC